MAPLFKSIKFRLTLWYVGSLTLIVVFFSIGLYFSLKGGFEKNIQVALEAVAQEAKRDIMEERSNVDDRTIEKDEFPIKSVYVQVMKISSAGTVKIVAKSGTIKNMILPLTAADIKKAGSKKSFFKTLDNESLYPHPLKTIFLPVFVNPRKRYIVLAAASLEKSEDALDDVLDTLFTLDPILIILAFAGGWLLINKTLSPVKKMVLSVQEITAEDLSRRIEYVGGKDEIGELAKTFNNMIARLEKSFERIKRFSADVSHELKTPITAMRGTAEVVLRKARKKSEYEDAFRSVLEEAEKMQTITDNMLFLSKTDGRKIEKNFREISLDDILLEVFEEMQPAAEKKNVRLILKELSPVSVKGNESFIKRLFANLINNAVKYTGKGGKAEISLEKKNGFAKFSVKDTGVGIPEKEIPYIFDRFYRVDKARDRAGGGSGLGLSIAKRITEIHGGRIEVKSKPGKGSAFTVFLPAFY